MRYGEFTGRETIKPAVVVKNKLPSPFLLGKSEQSDQIALVASDNTYTPFISIKAIYRSPELENDSQISNQYTAFTKNNKRLRQIPTNQIVLIYSFLLENPSWFKVVTAITLQRQQMPRHPGIIPSKSLPKGRCLMKLLWPPLEHVHCILELQERPRSRNENHQIRVYRDRPF